MAQAIINTRRDAQTAYHNSKDLFDIRIHPPGQAVVSQRRLATAMQELKRTWQNFEIAHIAYINRGQFEEGEREEANDEFLGVKRGYHDDMDEADEIMEQFQAADAPQEPPVLTPAQKLERVGIDITNRQNAMGTRAEAMEISLADAGTRFTSARLDEYSARCAKLSDDLDGLEGLYQEREDLDPQQFRAHREDSHQFHNAFLIRIDAIKDSINDKRVDPGGRTPAGGAAAAAAVPVTSYKEYKKEDIPTFNGSIRDFPPFKREWVTMVAPGRSADWQLMQLQKKTPKTIDLRNCRTIEEAWESLDDKYGNPVNVSETLITDFVKLNVTGKNDACKLVELRREINTLHNDLLAVGEDKQLIENTYLLQVAIKKVPTRYQEELMKLRDEKYGVPGETLYKILSDFLKSKSRQFEKYASWELNDPSEKKEASEIVCNRCHEKGHYAKRCTSKGYIRKSNALQVRDQAEFDRLKAEIGTCPLCKDFHTFTLKAGPAKGFDKPSDRLFVCPQFIGLSVADRAKKLQDVSGCAQCTSWKHKRDACPGKKLPCGITDGSGTCAKLHNRSVHGTNVAYCNAVQRLVQLNAMDNSAEESSSSNNDSSSPPLMHLVKYTFPDKDISTVLFMDDGSTCSLITHQMAGYLGIKGKKVVQWLEVAGKDYERFDTKTYNVKIVDRYGNARNIVVYGMDKITSNPDGVNVDQAYELFPHVPAGALERPRGEVGILIGQDVAGLLAGGGLGNDMVGDLRVMTTVFGSGYVLGGTHFSIKGGGVIYSPEAKKICHARFVKSFPNGRRVNLIRTKNLPEFLEAEELGVAVPRRCERCVGCTRCSFQVQEMCRKEQEEYRLLKKNVHYDTETKCVTATYPIIGDMTKLKNNRYQAVGMAVGLEKRLAKTKLMENYNKVFESYVDRNVLVEVKDQEIDDYIAKGGYINFISHHGVEKDTSTTTPLRLVSNSALKNCNTGPSVNDLWPKGPNSLSNLFEVFLRWRCYPEAAVWDLSKAYHSIKTTEREKFMRLLVWRYGELSEDWKTYGFDTVAFGDVPASVLLEICKGIASEEGASIDEEVALKVTRDSYVDDNLSGGTKEEVDKMIGEVSKLEDGSFKYSGTVAQILSTVGFKLKVIVRSGEKDPDALHKLGGRVLGHAWDAENDVISYSLPINISAKLRNMRIGPALTVDSLSIVDDEIFTRRKTLSVVNSFYDPVGLISAYLIKFKIQMKLITAIAKLDWDEPIPEYYQEKWRAMIREIVTAPDVVVLRGVKPEKAIGKPELIGYWDGSDQAYAAVIYIRWQVISESSELSWEASLLTAKARVTPVAGITTPRSELNGLVILARLLISVLKSMPEKPKRLTMIGDSECTISALDSTTASLAPYFANRIGEVDDAIKGFGKQAGNLEKDEELEEDQLKDGEVVVDPVFHTPGVDNPADLATRDGVQIHEVQAGSLWQRGPDYLRKHRSSWPISRQFLDVVPKEERRMKYYARLNLVFSKRVDEHRATSLPIKRKGGDPNDACPSEDDKENLGVRLSGILDYSDSLIKIRGIMARFLRSNVAKNQLTMSLPLDTKDYERADFMIKLIAMKDTNEMKEKFDLSGLAPFWSQGIWWTRGRMGMFGVRRLLGPDKLMILSPKSRLAWLIMVQCHNEDHRRDAGDALYRSRSHAWIVRGRPLAARVVKSCGWCNKERKQMIAQQMGDLPPQKFEIPCKPFTNICLDLTGPYEVKAMNNARSKLKCWPIVFCCLNTGALAIYVTAGYGTDAFLTQYNHYVAIRGEPRTVYSDRGSQLSKAATYVNEDDPDNWGWSQIQEKCAKAGTIWRFAPPGCQYRDGLAESRVKALKKTLRHIMTGASLNYTELCSLLARAANIINDRPLGVRHHGGAEGELVPITPNLLLLGKTSSEVQDEERYEEGPDKFTKRQKHMEELLSLWWSMWYAQVFDSLFPFNKWKEEKRNLEIGDVCLVKYDQKVGRADYRLCKVGEVDKDGKGLVRTVRVLMRPRDAREKSLPYISKDLVVKEVGVQRLVLICPVNEVEEILKQANDDKL